MSNAPVLQLSEPPDLLRRFVSLSYELCVRIQGLHLHLATNEPRLAAALGSIAGDCRSDSIKMQCTIFCDPDLSPDLGEKIEIDAGDSIFLSFGRACVIAIDREKRQITGFVAAGALEGAWPAIVVPALTALIVEQE